MHIPLSIWRNGTTGNVWTCKISLCGWEVVLLYSQISLAHFCLNSKPTKRMVLSSPLKTFFKISFIFPRQKKVRSYSNIVHSKIKICYHLLILMLSCYVFLLILMLTFYLQCNIKEVILKNVGNQIFLFPIEFHGQKIQWKSHFYLLLKNEMHWGLERHKAE